MQMLLAANEFASPQRAAATARRDQVGQFLARIEHARLDRGLGDADDIGDLLNRLAVVVDEVDHLAMLRRQFGQGIAQQFASVLLLQRGLRIIRGICDRGCDPRVQFRVDPTAVGRQRLVAGDREQPGRNRSARQRRAFSNGTSGLIGAGRASLSPGGQWWILVNLMATSRDQVLGNCDEVCRDFTAVR